MKTEFFLCISIFLAWVFTSFLSTPEHAKKNAMSWYHIRYEYVEKIHQ